MSKNTSVLQYSTLANVTISLGQKDVVAKVEPGVIVEPIPLENIDQLWSTAKSTATPSPSNEVSDGGALGKESPPSELTSSNMAKSTPNYG